MKLIRTLLLQFPPWSPWLQRKDFTTGDTEGHRDLYISRFSFASRARARRRRYCCEILDVTVLATGGYHRILFQFSS